jgi:hypothetical protein
LRHPVYQKPELLAERPNQVWSWDITKLKGPAKWSYFCLYVILDIYSRRVVGWCVVDSESAVLFEALFDDTITKHDVIVGQLTLHADRGGPMKAKATALPLSDLGVTRSHNRPHVSNDNPFSESHFRTLKYQPRFPKCFGCIEDARSFCRGFFGWYNQDRHHAGIGLMTPDQVHHGQIEAVHAARQLTLDQAFRRSPERFVKKPPAPPAKPTAAWINPPQPKSPIRMKVPLTLNASQHRMPLAGIVTANRDQAPICSTPHGPASLGFVTSRLTGYPRGQPKHSVDQGRHDVPKTRLTWPNSSAESL